MASKVDVIKMRREGSRRTKNDEKEGENSIRGCPSRSNIIRIKQNEALDNRSLSKSKERKCGLGIILGLNHSLDSPGNQLLSPKKRFEIARATSVDSKQGLAFERRYWSDVRPKDRHHNLRKQTTDLFPMTGTNKSVLRTNEGFFRNTKYAPSTGKMQKKMHSFLNGDDLTNLLATKKRYPEDLRVEYIK